MKNIILLSTLTILIITKGFAQEPMVLVYEIDEANTEIELPLSGTVDVTIDWGDGSTIDTVTTEGLKAHTYSSTGTFTIKINGSLTQYGMFQDAYKGVNKLISIGSFGSLNLRSLSGAFYGASKLTSVPTILPSTVTDASMSSVIS